MRTESEIRNEIDRQEMLIFSTNSPQVDLMASAVIDVLEWVLGDKDD